MAAPSVTASRDRPLLILAGMLFAACFFTGGSSQQTGAGANITQLLALPVLVYALTLAVRRGRVTSAWPSVVVVTLIVLMPVIQLFPLPQVIWELPALRPRLEHDLMAAGVTAPHYTWSLAPAATKRAVLLMLPAVALFFCALAASRESLRSLLWQVIVLSTLSLLLGIAQLGLPQDSIVNPYPQYVPSMAGVFANSNHQADALVVGLVLALALAVDARRRTRRAGGATATFRALFVLSLLLGLSLLVVRSRAGIIIGIFATVAVLVAFRAISLKVSGGSWLTRFGFLIAAVGLALAAYGALVGLQGEEIDAVSGTRGLLATQTTMLGVQNAPLGSGIGSFVPLFEQYADSSLLQREYINHAHNEYAQWWLEGGVLAVACIIAGIWVLIMALRKVIGLHRDSRLRASGIAALMGLATMLVHSFVDYPLRTPALMAVFALLAGIAFSAAAQAKLPSPTEPAN